MEILHNPRCKKSRETLQILKDHNVEPEVIQYLKNPPTAAEIIAIAGKLQIPVSKMIRRGEKVYKEYFKDRDLSNEAWAEALSENPILIERPIVIRDERAVIGRPPESVKALL